MKLILTGLQLIYERLRFYFRGLLLGSSLMTFGSSNNQPFNSYGATNEDMLVSSFE